MLRCFRFLSPTMSQGSSSPSMGLQHGSTKSTGQAVSWLPTRGSAVRANTTPNRHQIFALPLVHVKAEGKQRQQDDGLQQSEGRKGQGSRAWDDG